MDRSSYPAIEYDISVEAIQYVKELLNDSLIAEVRAYASTSSDFNIEHWQECFTKALPMKFDEMPKLWVSYDMGWQKRSSGHRYDSHSGHAALVGTLTRKPITVSVLNKLCRICSRSDGESEPDMVHDCLINFDKEASSGSMEPHALVQMSQSLLDSHYVLIDTIVADDDSSVRAQMKWSNADWMVHNNTNQAPKTWNETRKVFVKHPDHGKLKYPYPEPKFVGDPSHRTKLVGKHCFQLQAKRKDISKGTNKVDALTIKKNFAYMVRQLSGLDESKWEDAGKAVIEHYFKNHIHCGDWCNRKKMSLEELEGNRKATGKYYRCKQREPEVYKELKAILDPFITKD
jgi:hypothetical protein